FRVNLRPPSKGARLPTPVATKAGAMPTDERLWTDDRDDLQDRRKPSIQLDKEQAIAVRKPDASVDYPAQHNHLVSERRIFGFKSALRLKWRDQDVKNKTEQRDHCAPTLGDSLPQSIRIRFSVHTHGIMTSSYM